ncbi:hypothetical protein C0995_016063 [Termitomyces sp. Mi166|nr:hypothetical protein C0995_016063 [Termitomyces sp. Mi166\
MLATLGMAITAIFSSHANGIHTTTYRNGEIVDRQFCFVAGDAAKSNAYRMDNLEAGGIHVQRDVVEMADDQSVNSWERHHADVKTEI